MKTDVAGCKRYVFGMAVFVVMLVASCSPEEVPEEIIIEVESLSLNEASVSLTEGGSVTLTVTVIPADAAVKTVTWSSSADDVATVADGVVEAISPGTAVVTARSVNGKTVSCAVTVTDRNIAVEGIVIDRQKLTLVVGTSSALTATVQPADATDRSITWASDNVEVATVDDRGAVAALAVGTAKITAGSGNFSATCDVAVTAQRIPATKIELNRTSISLAENAEERLEATVSPGNTTDTVAWSSRNTQIAVVDSRGVVRAVGLGSAVIVARAGDESATCDVTVTPASGDVIITLSKTILNLTMGDSERLEATVYAPDGSEHAIEWKSGNTQVATVDNDGLVTAAGVGAANITASAGGQSVACAVTVSPLYVKVTGIHVEPSAHTMDIGEDVRLSVRIEPSNATSGEVIWYSKDSRIATVDVATGLVRAVAAGRVAVVAMAGENEDISDSCVITVTPAYIPVTEIVLDRTEVTLTEGGTVRITATVTPADATDRTVTWTSLHPDIATVDGDGNVVAVLPGTATVTAQAGDKSAACTVTVNEQEGVTIDFQDPVFENLLLERGFDLDGNDRISTDEVSKITRLDCRSQLISSLDGIQYFRSLEELICRDNLISSIDISRNTSLKYVDIRNNSVGVLEVGTLTKLETLICDENELEEINVDNNALLKTFSCSGNKLESLDVSHNPELHEFNCSINELTGIDVGNNRKLVYLYCNGNDLSGEGLDISRNELLAGLFCGHCGLTELDPSHNPKLTELYCENNDLQTLDISGNDRLASLFCHDNRISGELDISNLKNMDGFDCTSNEIEKLYISPELRAILDLEMPVIKIFRYDPDVTVEVKP
ncbi:MAG: Ig-like domain-containing protein [Tannerella sp.]|jgi:uncharacterized protein YjdB|nr:Ig-like domain-containing protein [Tannerella sp.]